MPVPLLDLRAQHATIRDEVVDSDDGGRRLAAVHSWRGRREARAAGRRAVAHEVRDRLRERHRCAVARACARSTSAAATKSSRRRSRSSRRRERSTTSARRRCSSTSIRRRSTFVRTPPRPASTSKTKAVIPVDLFGQMAAIEEVMTAMPGVPVIEDAAQIDRRASRRSTANGAWPARWRPSARSASSRRRISAATATAA